MPRKATSGAAAKKAAAPAAQPITKLSEAFDSFRYCMDLVEDCSKAVDAAPTVHVRRLRLRNLGQADLVMEFQAKLDRAAIEELADWIRGQLQEK
jgi:hypothetical protein